MYNSNSTESLDTYLEEIGEVDLIGSEEEVRLARLIDEGDDEALNKLVRSNLRFVVTVAKKYQGQGLSLADLINEGNYGLIKAARRFDETLGFKFISYAVWWIRQAIMQALAEQSRSVRIPLNRIGTISKVRRERERLKQEKSRNPTPEELAQELDIDAQKVREAMEYSSNQVSMDAPFQEGEDNSLLDIMENSNAEIPDQQMNDSSVSQDIERALNSIKPREAEIARLYFGIGHEYPLTLDEIGKRFNLTRERVRQLKEKALKKLRNYTEGPYHDEGGLKNHISI